MKSELSGIIPAIASPCDETDRFLDDRFSALAEHLYRQGVHGLYVCGATGEGSNMLAEERQRAAEIAVENGRRFDGCTVVHVGTSTTRDSAALAEHAASVGVDAVSAMPPAFRSFEQIVTYYSELHSASGLPVIVYYIPVLVGQVLTLDQMLRLVDIPGVVGFKFSDWNLYLMSQVLRQRPDVIAFNGNDEFICPGLLYGARGGIGMNYNVLPRFFLRVYDLVNTGEISQAMKLQHLFLEYIDVLWRYDLRAGFAAAMRALGHATHVWRRPRPTLDGETEQHFLAEWRPIFDRIQQAVAST